MVIGGNLVKFGFDVTEKFFAQTRKNMARGCPPVTPSST